MHACGVSVRQHDTSVGRVNTFPGVVKKIFMGFAQQAVCAPVTLSCCMPLELQGKLATHGQLSGLQARPILNLPFRLALACQLCFCSTRRQAS